MSTTNPGDAPPSQHAGPPDGAVQEWLAALMAREVRPGPYTLDVMRLLLERLGHPERGFRALHVAGTRGKGSTAALAESALRAAGHRVGLTTSPHLVSPTERVRIDGVDLAPSELLGLAEEVQRTGADLAPSFFEVLVACAFLAFARAGVAVGVVEVGLGGRLDATNLVQPATCVLTRLGLDHADRLGGTRTAVALEKAGILKPGVRAVLGLNGVDATLSVRERAALVGAPLRRVTAADVLAAPPTNLAGTIQAENAACAAAALAELATAEPDLAVSPEQLAEGFLSTRWRARLELLPQPDGPADLLLDVAHDVDAVAALATHVRFLARPVPAFVFTCLADKDLVGMVRVLAGSDLARATVCVPELAVARATPAPRVANSLREAGFVAVEAPSVAAASRLAMEVAASRLAPSSTALRPIVPAFGSFAVVEGILRGT